jgi:hypothetical protein
MKIIVAAKLVVYANEPEEYFTFMTTEAYSAVKEWMDFRASFGEEIIGESWILRNTWQKVKPRYSHRIGLAKYLKQFKSTGMLRITCLAIAAIGLLATVSTLNLMNSIPTTFAQPMATATNNTQGMLTKLPFKPGIFVTPMSCITPNDVLISRHQAGNSSAAEQLVKNQIMMAGGPNNNFTAS